MNEPSLSAAYTIFDHAETPEKPQTLDRWQALTKYDPEIQPERFFSAYEVGAWRDLDPTTRLEGFFNCWTRKEAYLKARGFGLSVSLDSFDVSLAPGVPAALLRGCDGWSVQSFSPAAGFEAAVVAEATDWRLNFQSNDGQSGQITGNG